MDWLLALVSKVGGSVFAVAFIIFIAFISYILGVLIKNRISIKNSIFSWVEREKKYDDMIENTKTNTKDIEEIQSKIDKCYETIEKEREDFLAVQQQLGEAIAMLSEKIDDIKTHENERQRAKLKDRIGEMYNYYHNSKVWNSMQKEALEDLVSAYEKAGGDNSFVHTTVVPESYTWELKD